jgi:hypothetical protein
VRRALAGYAVYWENQAPGVYRGEPSFPRSMVDGCAEGAGGNNVRHFVCDSGGVVRRVFRGYWKPAKFLELLGSGHEDPEGFVGRPVQDALARIAEEVYTKGKTG